ncbi:DUF5644 domain-containing protein [Helicobacter sp. MIT 14-3879]|uniref:DUF5644 domain-containing protein n=1 Tax=Helicobacter sp. MIT 14-3879 TaxID=2040649 RepID=UPI000E1FA107|nr:DUF5644 domain-containing protein [Helicobacter sp. MIT 14-3879]RDU62627.1 hypothetical protein CQA44_06480 [Helicobacter sp. MIT 14-3879]
MDFKIKVFRFDCKKDYNEYYQNLNINIDDNLSLKELMQNIKEKLDDFSYDVEVFGFRINNKVIFHNLKLQDIKEQFGNILEINPISQKYASKDLLINKEEIFNKYKKRLDKFSFLNEESKNEFKKYILINLISPLDLDDYIGDGYAMYIKWMCIHYQNNTLELLSSISNFEDGVINHISTKDMIYPNDSSIDTEIESIQKMLLQKEYEELVKDYLPKLKKTIQSKYKIIH